MNKHLISLAVAIGFGIGGNAFAADAMPKDAYKAEKDKIEEQAKADKKIAKAELDAKNKPGAKADEKVRLMKAEGEHEVAKEKCEDQQGAAIATCKKDAKASYDKAKTAAKQAGAGPKADAKSKS